MASKSKLSDRPFLKNTVSALIWTSIMTSSFDVVLNLEAAGVTFRFTQLLAAAVIVLFAAEAIRGAAFRFPVSFGYLVLVFLFNTVWIYRSRDTGNAIGYDLWLAFNLLEILAFSYFLSLYETLDSLLQKYIVCFDILAAVGILQFLLELAGIRFFAMQFYETPYGFYRRANGFSYEPSYYATYMLMGCGACLYLLEKKNHLAMGKRMLCVSAVLNVGALILSTSRIGWLILIAYLMSRSALGMVRYCQRRAHSKAQLVRLLAAPLLVLLLASVVILGLRQGNSLVLVYTQGLGLGGDMRSAGPRITALLDTWTIFKNSPFQGFSLGGIDSEIACIKGLSYATELNGSYSMCVSVEALAAYGLIGAILFFKYIYDTTVGCYCRIRTAEHLEAGKKQLIYALLLGHVLVFMALQFNQNILRQPYWAHLAVISAAELLFTTKREEGQRKAYLLRIPALFT